MAIEISNAYNSYVNSYVNGAGSKKQASGRKETSKTTNTSSIAKTDTSDYLAELQKKNPKLNILTGYSNGAAGSSNYPEKINVTIAPEFLAKMQSDPELAAEYEKSLAGIPAACKWGESMIRAMTGSTVYEFRFYIDKNGNMSAGSVSGPSPKEVGKMISKRKKQQEEQLEARLEARKKKREEMEEKKEQEEQLAKQRETRKNELPDGVIYTKGSESAFKLYTSKGTLQNVKTSTSKSKYSGQEILDEINKYISAGQFYAIHYNGKETWLQGMTSGKNSVPVGDKKYFDPDELEAVLGKNFNFRMMMRSQK